MKVKKRPKKVNFKDIVIPDEVAEAFFQGKTIRMNEGWNIEVIEKKKKFLKRGVE